ncbi:MAG: leucine-rich repeat domain-containing protein, partial [Muribaculaceae bacterium]|nr:leucine-rich repeat domain-containing protein [Muribaculaceae bacterium]
MDETTNEATVTGPVAKSVTSVVIPESVNYQNTDYSVISIGDYAFKDCSNLTELTIGNSVTTIGNAAFGGCTGLSNLNIEDGSQELFLGYHSYSSNGGGKGLFYDCPLENVYIGRNLNYRTDGNYGISPFHSIRTLTSLIIGNVVTSIRERMFDGCWWLSEVTIGSAVTSIGGYAFYDCLHLSKLNIPDSVTSIGEAAFNGCKDLSELIIGDSLTSIEDYVFLGCSGITKLIIGNSVSSIGSFAFYGCTGLTEVFIPNSVTSIKSNAFEGCSNLTELIIGSSVTSIGGCAFSGCTSLKTLTIEDGTSSISWTPAYSGGRGVFGDCPLEKVYLGRNFSFPSNMEYKYLPFNSKNTLVSLVIGDMVTLVENHAFSGCSNLTEVTLGTSIESIGEYAFGECKGITDLTIPNSVITIGQSALSGCSNLKSITIPSSVISIENYAFQGCTGIKDLTIEDGDAELKIGYNSWGFSSTGQGLFYHCPLESVYLGRNLSYESGEKSGYSPFYSKTKLTSLTISNSVTKIGEYAFNGCCIIELTI